MKISPQLIPHSEFHRYSWLQSTERPSWYYFKKSKPHHHILNKDFLMSVDEPLRELVSFLHHRGIHTTPSCSGHHINERNLEKIYSNLVEDANIIHQKGLDLIDVESGQVEHYSDKNYILPWNREKFVNELYNYQHKGVIGIKPNDEMLKSYLMELQFGGVRVDEKDNIVFIFTNEENTYDIRTIWSSITQEIQSIIK